MSVSPQALADLTNAQRAAVAHEVVLKYGPTTSVGTQEEYDSAIRTATIEDAFEDILNNHNFGLDFVLTDLANGSDNQRNAAYNMTSGMFAELPGGSQAMQNTMFNFLDDGLMVTYTDMKSYKIRHVEGTPIYDASCRIPGIQACVMATVESDLESNETGRGPEYMSVVFGAVGGEDGEVYWQYLEDSPTHEEHQYVVPTQERSN